MSVQNSTTSILLLPEWSVTTPAYVRYSNRGKDTPRSRWESIAVRNHAKPALCATAERALIAYDVPFVTAAYVRPEQIVRL